MEPTNLDTTVVIIIGIVAFFGAVLAATIRIVNEYERGVIFRLGRLMGARGPGLFFIIPIVERMVRIDLRVITMDIPSQEVITRDNVTIRVNAVLYFRIVDPNLAVTAITTTPWPPMRSLRPRCAMWSDSPNWTNCSPSAKK